MNNDSLLVKPRIAIAMGSRSDWATMKHTVDMLKQLSIPCHTRIVSAHRTPDWLFDFASTAEEKGYKVLIAGAGSAAHLPGMLAAKTPLPVIGVPIQSRAFNGLDSLLSIVQMPAGVPVGTVAIGEAGAKNAALLAAAILALSDSKIRAALEHYRQQQTQAVLKDRLTLDGEDGNSPEFQS